MWICVIHHDDRAYYQYDGRLKNPTLRRNFEMQNDILKIKHTICSN